MKKRPLAVALNQAARIDAQRHAQRGRSATIAIDRPIAGSDLCEVRPNGPRPLDLYGRAYDFPVRHRAPAVEYMLAAIPRSGSTHLSMELWRTGVMGAPLEYANPSFRNVIRKRLGFRNALVAYWRALKRVRTSPNGVFGFKMFTGNYMHYCKHNAKLLRLIAPHKVVFLTREDVVKQAVSYSKAIRSGAWFHGVPRQAIAVYDAEHIRRCVEMIRYQHEFWQEIFSLTGTLVHHVTYETVVADTDAAIRGIAAFLGVDFDPNVGVDLPHMHVQRDAESDQWLKHFNVEPPPSADGGSRTDVETSK